MSSQRRVEILPYDQAWADQYKEEAGAITKVLGERLVAVHHVGSTSIPGLAAKPIIDILPVLRDIETLVADDAGMQALGYEGLGEYGLPARRYFRKLDGQRHLVHVHAYGESNPEIERHLAFRDYLIAHAEKASQYAKLKMELAQRYPHDSEAYQDGKHDWIQATEQLALDWYRIKARRK